MIRTYSILRPRFADGGQEVEHTLTIHPKTQWNAARAFHSPGPGAHTRVLDLNGALGVIVEWQFQGWPIRFEDRELVDK